MRKFTLAFVLICLVWGQTFAQNPAGIVLYFKSGGDIYLLLAEDAKKTRGWASFGGGAHNGETMAETAARETEEETNGYFSRSDLLKKIKNQTPVMDNTFALFFAEVPFVPIFKVTNHQPLFDDPSYFERGPYAWVPFSEIEKFLQADIDRTQKYPIDKSNLPPESQTDWFWPTWLRSIRSAVVQDMLPWNNLKQKTNPVAH